MSQLCSRQCRVSIVFLRGRLNRFRIVIKKSRTMNENAFTSEPVLKVIPGKHLPSLMPVICEEREQGRVFDARGKVMVMAVIRQGA